MTGWNRRARHPRAVASAAWHSLFWLVFANCRGRADRDSAAGSRSEPAIGRVDLRPLDDGAHESGALRLGQPSPGGISLQGLRRGPRTGRRLVPAGALGLVRRPRRRRLLLALRPFQRQALPRLERIRTRAVSRRASGALAAAGLRPGREAGAIRRIQTWLPGRQSCSAL